MECHGMFSMPPQPQEKQSDGKKLLEGSCYYHKQRKKSLKQNTLSVCLHTREYFLRRQMCLSIQKNIAPLSFKNYFYRKQKQTIKF